MTDIDRDMETLMRESARQLDRILKPMAREADRGLAQCLKSLQRTVGDGGGRDDGPPRDFIRAKEVAERLNLPVRSVYRLISDGRLEGFQTGGKGSAILISDRSVDDFIRDRIRAFQESNGIL